MEDLQVFLPIDRWLAILRHQKIPDRVEGSALFADVPGFTALTETLSQALGPQRGAEELTAQLNRVYSVLIDEVHHYRGSVIAFSGDSINCWFEDDDGRRALAAGLAMQAGISQAHPFSSAGQVLFQPSIKCVITVGPAHRFLVGDPAIQRMDMLTGRTLDRLEDLGHLVQRGEVLLETSAARRLTETGLKLYTAGQRQDASRQYSAEIVTGLAEPVLPEPWPEAPDPTDMDDETLAAWIQPAVLKRLRAGAGRFLASLRPVSALFLNFGGLDYEQDEAELLLDAYLRKVQECLLRYEGIPLQLNTGDKGNYLYAAFGAPDAHDDDAARAVTAGVELIRISADTGYITNARVGIAQGILYAGAYGSLARQTYGLIGDKVNLAARLMQQARPGEVLCDSAVAAQARRYWAFETLPAVALKGKSRPIAVYRAAHRLPTAAELAPGEPARRLAGSDPFVGRLEEITRLDAALDRLQAGSGAALFIEGEAGIGKSRLVDAFLRRAAGRGIRGLLGAGQSIEQNMPYRAWRDIFSVYFQLEESDHPAARQEKVRRGVEQAAPRMLLRLPLLNEILSLGLAETPLTTALTPSLRKESLFDLLLTLLRGLVREQPLLLILDDAHWLDALSWDLALYLARTLISEGAPLLLVMVSRPVEETHPGAQQIQALRRLPYSQSMVLGGLADDALVELITSRLGLSPAGLPRPLFKLVRERSAGNPFFAEEFLHSMRDQGLIWIETGPDGPICRTHANLAEESQALPGTVQGLILSRIDRLAPEQQLAVKVAAVIGRTFAYPPLRDTLNQFIALDDPALKAQLSALVQREMTQLVTLEPELSYIFKHIITQETAYQSLLHAQRKEIHALVAGWYEARLAQDESLAPPLLPLLAYHYQMAENTGREHYYARKAGEAAAKAYANDAALKYFARVLELTPTEDLETIFAVRQQRLEITKLQGDRALQQEEIEAMERAAALLADLEKQAAVFLERSRYEINQNQFSPAEHDARQALDLARQAGNKDLELQSLLSVGTVLWRQGNYPDARETMEPALETAHAHGLFRWEGELLNNLGIVADLSGSLSSAQAHFTRAQAIFHEAGLPFQEANAINNVGITFWRQGNLPKARGCFEQALKIQREIGARSGETYPLGNLAMIFNLERSYQQGAAYAREALALAKELGLPYVESRALGLLGNSYEGMGDLQQAISVFLQALAVDRASSDRQDEAYRLENISYNYLQIGDFDTARTYLEDALRLGREIGDREMEFHIENDYAILFNNLGDFPSTVDHCQRSLAILQETGQVIDKEKVLFWLGEGYLGSGDVEKASAAYLEALEILKNMSRPVIEVQAGLARVDLARGNVQQAAARAEEILSFLENDTVEDVEDPAKIYLTVYQVLDTLGDPRCGQVLEQGYQFLQNRSRRLDEKQRQRYLENLPANHSLCELWDAMP